MHTIHRLLIVATFAPAVLTTPARVAAQLTTADAAAIAPSGRLRVGVYPGSPTSMIRDGASGNEKGLTVDLGRELGRRLGVPVDLVEFGQIADVLAALRQGSVDFTVTNASPSRASDADFSQPVLGVELGYLVPARSMISDSTGIDRAGVRVGVTAGGSSHATLTRELARATVVPAPTLQAAVAMLRAEELDAYATNKAILFEMADQLPGSRVLNGRWGIEVFAVAIPQGRAPALAAIGRFAEAVQSEGLVARAAERAGLRGVAPLE